MQSRIEEKVDAVLAAEVASGGPGAAIAVIRNGQFIHRKAYGLANIEWGVPLNPDCVFRIASLTKQFTAVAIMILVERGLVSADAPIETYLAAWPPRRRKVTVRHLLNHTSGIWSHDGSHIDRTLRPDPPVDEVIGLIFDGDFAFEPGDRYGYNNSGYLLLGAIIQAVSGRPYEDFLREAIFEPLGMSQTRILRPEAITPQRACGYVRGRKRFHNARLDAMNWSHAAGALGSTLDDLARWDRAIRANRLISSESLETMLAPTTLTDGSIIPYGFGWGMGVYDGRRIYHHTGGISGYASQMLHLRDEDLTTIVLSNLFLFPTDKVTRGLLRAALELPAAISEDVSLPDDQPAACAGAFARDGYVRSFFPCAGGLAIVEGGPPVLRPLGHASFRQVDDPEVEFHFSDLRDGRYQLLTYVSPLWPDNVLDRVAET
ncbi:MAG TPA: serine hydrolase domain-containing protein [Caulobacteraceae bacterium]|jgi:CubicO group peptidase (beta-lactamase class C family)